MTQGTSADAAQMVRPSGIIETPPKLTPNVARANTITAIRTSSREKVNGGMTQSPPSRMIEALALLDAGVTECYPSRIFALLSGGDDSLTVTKLASQHPLFAGAIHLDTGTGVPETRAFVEATCSREGWPLHVYSAPVGTYERLVLEGYTTRKGELHQGFPRGPKSHATMYWHLKQRQLQAALKQHKRSLRDRIGFVTGVRIPESARRAKAKMARAYYKDPERSIVWLQPIIDWTKAECLDYLETTGTPRNPVSVNCHRSGECLCGALANNAELAEIAFFYPSVGERYSLLEAQARAGGVKPDQWAGGPTTRRNQSRRNNPAPVTQPLCTSCQLALF